MSSLITQWTFTLAKSTVNGKLDCRIYEGSSNQWITFIYSPKRKHSIPNRMKHGSALEDVMPIHVYIMLTICLFIALSNPITWLPRKFVDTYNIGENATDDWERKT